MNSGMGTVGNHFRGYFPYTVTCMWYLFSQHTDFQHLPGQKLLYIYLGQYFYVMRFQDYILDLAIASKQL